MSETNRGTKRKLNEVEESSLHCNDIKRKKVEWIGCDEAALWQQLPTDCVKTVVEYLDSKLVTVQLYLQRSESIEI
jgi:hypothetical protein